MHRPASTLIYLLIGSTIVMGIQAASGEQTKAKDNRRDSPAQAQDITTSQPSLINTFISKSNAYDISSTSSDDFFAQTTLPVASDAGTSIAVFTAGGGKYTATAVSNVVLVAGYQLHVGGPTGLVGGVAVSAATNGFEENGQLIPYSAFIVVASTQPAMATASATRSTVISTSYIAASTTASSTGAATAHAVSSIAALAVVGVAAAAQGLI